MKVIVINTGYADSLKGKKPACTLRQAFCVCLVQVVAIVGIFAGSSYTVEKIWQQTQQQGE